MLIPCLLSTVSPAAETPCALDEHLAGVALGQKESLSRLYLSTRDAVYGFALSLLKNPHDAEDVLQDAYLAVWNSAPGYRSQGKPMAWLLTIVRNLCLQKLRERQRQSDLPQESWESWLRDKEGMTAEDKAVLAECMARLTDEERHIVVLHAVGGLRHRETAVLLGLPLSTVLSKYARALKKLKEHL